MNTGIGDAINLAWKLAKVVAGGAHPVHPGHLRAGTNRFRAALVATTDRMFQRPPPLGGISGWVMRQLFLGVSRRCSCDLAAYEPPSSASSRKWASISPQPARGGKAGKISGGERLPFLRHAGQFRPLESLDWQIHLFDPASDN